MRTRLALAAALPLVATLAACSTAAGTAPAPASPTSSGKSSPSSTVQDVTSHKTPTTTNDDVTHSRPTPAAHRPTVQDGLDTVRSYMKREIGMRDPRLSRFRWTGKDAATVEVRAWIASEGVLGPKTTVSLQRLRTVWFVTGAHTAGIVVHNEDRLTGTVASPVTLSVRLTDGQPWDAAVTQDRYGQDVVLGGDLLVGERDRPFEQQITFDRPTGATGSVILSQNLNQGGGAVRATVIRIRFVPGPKPPSCAPAAFLPAFGSWYSAAPVARVRVLRCRDEFAHVVTVGRATGHDRPETLEAYLQYWSGAWHVLDAGAHPACDAPDRVLEQACNVLGYTD